MKVDRNDKAQDQNQFGQSPEGEKGNEGQKTQRSRGLAGINRSFSRGISRGRLAESVVVAQKRLESLVKDANSNQKHDRTEVLVFNGESENARMSALVQTLASSDGRTIAYHTMVLEASAEKLGTVDASHDNLRYDRVLVPSDIASEVNYRRKVEAVVQAKFPGKVVKSTGFFVVARENDLFHKDEEMAGNAVKDLAYAAGAANEALLDIIEQVPPFNIAEIYDAEKETVFSEVTFNPADPTMDMNGLPVRSDIRVSTWTQTSENSGQRPLVTIDAFVDLVLDTNALVSSSPYQQQQTAYGQQAPRPQPYIARIVLSNIFNEFDLMTPETELFGMALSTILARDSLFTGRFRPRKDVKGVDFGDLGAANCEIGFIKASDPSKPPQPIDTKENSFTDTDAFEMITQLISQVPIFSLDVARGGERTWLQKTFLLAAQGNQTEKEAARKLLIKAAGNLTGGKFYEFFKDDGTTPIVTSDQNMIHLGYYYATDEESKVTEKRDNREIDRLAMLNAVGSRNMERVDQFTQTFDNIQEDQEFRLARRLSYVDEMFGGVTVKDVADRVNISNTFLNAILLGLGKAGFSVAPKQTKTRFAPTVRGRTDIRGLTGPGLSQDVFNGNPNMGGYRGGPGGW